MLHRKLHKVVHVFSESNYYEFKMYDRGDEHCLDAIYKTTFDKVQIIEVERTHLSAVAAYNHALQKINADIMGVVC